MTRVSVALAVDGGAPVRTSLLPYGRQTLDEADIAAVVDVLRSDWLTTGPKVTELESAFATAVGARHAVAVNSGTAALHAAVEAVGIGPGDEVIVPAITFAATANAVAYQGGTPVFADVCAETLLIDPTSVEQRVTRRTKAIIAVDYAGQPCAYADLRRIAEKNGMALIADASHALGAAEDGVPVGALADVTTFSLHPVKHITTGEGGIVTTDDAECADRMRVFRNHGISVDHGERKARGTWQYEIRRLGYNYRLTDFQSALGISQLRKLPGWIARRQAIAKQYDEAFAGHPAITSLLSRPCVTHSRHLYVTQLVSDVLTVGRAEVFRALRAEGIGVNVHYIPVHLHPFYQERFGTARGLCPAAEAAYEQILSLPIFPAMTDSDVGDVIAAVRKVCEAYTG